MEKLIIKNFGPIKHIELDVKKFTFLIGEQSSGKSTIAKVLSIVKDAFVVIGIRPILDKSTKLGLNNYFGRNTLIQFEASDYNFTIKSVNAFEITPKSKALKDAVKQIKPLYKLLESLPSDSTEIAKNLIGNQGINTSVYIPAERILISYITGRPFDYLNKDVKLPGHISDFGKIFQDAREQKREFQVNWLNATYQYNNGEDWILFKKKRIRMSESATGFQNIFPLLLAFECEQKIENSAISFFVEEPELSLFPKTQASLVKHMVQRCIVNESSLLVTTHSPYILAAFNNLLCAYNVGQKHQTKVKKIISENLWVNPEDVTAIYLDGKGKAKNLMLEDIQQISVDEMDAISGEINAEYDQLLNIEYSKK